MIAAAWGRAGPAARGLPPPRPGKGCEGVCPGPAEAQRPALGSAGSSSLVPDARPCARGPEAPREANMATTFHHYAPERDQGRGSEPPTCPWPVSLMSLPSPAQRPVAAAASAPLSGNAPSPCIREAEGEAEGGRQGRNFNF